ncbi:MAG: hypothetical protein GTN78_12015, partial [Gemmatimonadales bacterium]|nr:hypothetical protein [Gemmatimonadales bacterium]
AEQQLDPTLGSTLVAEFNCRESASVRTPLWAKAVVLSDGEMTLAVVTLDAYGLRPEAAERARELAGRQARLSPERVMLVCSGTRAAPCTTPVVGGPEVDQEYTGHMVQKVAQVVAQAKQELQPASLGSHLARLPHLVYNHRLLTRNQKAITSWLRVPKDEVLEPEGPVDPDLRLLVVRDGSGFPMALLWNFAADNRFSQDEAISADLPHLVQEQVDERSGKHLPTLYLAGCTGNTSFHGSLEQVADACASAVMAVQLETPCDPSIKLGCLEERMVLPIRDYAEFWSQWDIQLKYPEAEPVFAHELELLKQQGAHGVPANVQAFRLGRFCVVGLPGMPFVEFALQVKTDSPFAATLVSGNANGHVGHVITWSAFAHEGFESWPARSAVVGPGGGEFMASQAVSLLHRLWRA